MKDEGLAAERTSVSWWRTGLSVSAAGAVVSRLALPALGPSAVLASAAALLLLLWLRHESVARYRGTRPGSRRPRSRDGVSHAALTAAVLILCLIELAAILARAGRVLG
jgi:uncharacterized membrane protein YidH (DUF202 family)